MIWIWFQYTGPISPASASEIQQTVIKFANAEPGIMEANCNRAMMCKRPEAFADFVSRDAVGWVTRTNSPWIPSDDC